MMTGPFKSTVLRWLGMLMVGALLAACGGTDGGRPRFSANFESGSIGEVKALDTHGRAWELALRNDNNNASLPHSFRTWWFVRADDVPVDQPLQLVFTRLGFPHYFVPVPDSGRLSVSKRFDASTVWIARTFPYTTQDLAAFLESVASSPFVKMRSLGESPAFGLPLTLLTLADDEWGRALRERYVFQIVPMHNPDGVVLGPVTLALNLHSSNSGRGFP